MDCSICLTSTNKSTRSPITCFKCETTVCRTCIQQYLLQDATADPACPECHTAWPQEFQVDYLTATFRNGPLKAHKRAVLLERERAQLPATMPDAVAYKAAAEFIETHSAQTKSLTSLIYGCEEYKALSTLRNACDAAIRASGNDFRDRVRYMNGAEYADFKMRIDAANAAWQLATEIPRNELKELNALLHAPRTIVAHYGRTDSAQQQQQTYTYLYKCVRSGCAGFLKMWACELCATQVCSECRMERCEAEHTCDPIVKESISAITEQAKPCPSCAAMISKVDGCDQMWCTQCKTAFSWTSGAIETAVIHNPHYYHWMRTQVGVVPARAPAMDGNCEAYILDAVEHTIVPYLTDTNDDERRVAAARIFDSIRKLRHLEVVRLGEYRQYITYYNDPDWRRVLRVRILIGDLTEHGWAHALLEKTSRYERTQAEMALLTMYIQTSKDILGQIVGSSDTSKFTKIYAEYQGLLTYTLAADEKLKDVYNSSGIGLAVH